MLHFNIFFLYRCANILDVYLSSLFVCTEYDPTSRRFICWLLFQTFIYIYIYSSVLQNFKIFTHSLLHFSNSTLPLTEVEFKSCAECIYFNNKARKILKTFSDFILQPLGKVFRTFLPYH